MNGRQIDFIADTSAIIRLLRRDVKAFRILHARKLD